MIHSITDCISKNFDPFLQDSKKIKGMDIIANLFFSLFSQKQSVRPDSIVGCIRESLPVLKHSLDIQFFSVVCAIRNVLGIRTQDPYKEDIKALQILHDLEKCLNEKKEVRISLDEKQFLSTFFEKISNSPAYFSKLEHWLTFTRQSLEIFKTFKSCKDLTKVVFEDVVDPLEKKLESIGQFLNSSRTTLEDPLKLKPLDYHLLFYASSKKRLIGNLRDLGVQFNRAQEL